MGFIGVSKNTRLYRRGVEGAAPYTLQYRPYGIAEQYIEKSPETGLFRGIATVGFSLCGRTVWL
jgi:hypothetical protein